MPSVMLSGEEATFATSPESGHIFTFISPWKTGVMLSGLMKHTSAIAPVNKTHVTRKANKEYNSTCIVERRRKNNSWMFWGCFVGTRAGPCVFWERNWGWMTGESYRQRILPDALGFIGSLPTNNGQAILMHDNAPVHTAAPAREYLEANGVVTMAWPPFS
ncbi:hypothetical protein K3495_g13780 [Podosphaera aphanis]|nr:hypothetical protein K3495_g13780 [Podosphaera aphanis]